MWLTYSVNKEDIWVSRVQLPIRTVWDGPVKDNFDNIVPGGIIPNWNIYRPQWCEVKIDSVHHLCLTDEDPYDYARAIRVFDESQKVTLRFDLKVEAVPCTRCYAPRPPHPAVL